MSSLFNVVLVEPEIPNNTGNIGRTCVGTNSQLHLVEPLGFEINDKQLRRAGLDYWPHLNWHRHASWGDFMESSVRPQRLFYFSTKAEKDYLDFDYQIGDGFVFGKETAGLGEEFVGDNSKVLVKIPMLGPIRSLNLANSVSIVLYEALRQNRAAL